MTSNSPSNCSKCGGPMNMHYGLWCPKCNKPKDENFRVLEAFKVVRYIAAQEGYAYNWERQVFDGWEIPSNDCFISWYVPEYDSEYDFSEAICQFNTGLKKHFDVKPNETVLLSVSW